MYSVHSAWLEHLLALSSDVEYQGGRVNLAVHTSELGSLEDSRVGERRNCPRQVCFGVVLATDGTLYRTSVCAGDTEVATRSRSICSGLPQALAIETLLVVPASLTLAPGDHRPLIEKLASVLLSSCRKGAQLSW